jgi:hypothetical protein
MSTDQDTLLAARFAALAPEPLAGNWDEVLERAGTAPEGHRAPDYSRVVHSPRRRLIVVLAAVAVVAVATASAFAVRALTDNDIVGLPPVGATPSAPGKGVREMFFWVPGPRAHDYARSSTWVYADGRVIRFGARQANGRPLREAFNRWSMGFVEQRLTREGVRLLRSEIVSAGGFGDAQPPPGSDPLGNGATIEVRKGDQLVHLRWASDLARLEARLTDLSWLPASAWKQRTITAYVPSRFKVCAAVMSKNGGGRDQGMSAARIVALLPEAAQNVLRDREWNAREAGPGCFAVTTNEARPLATALEDAMPAKKGRLSYRFDAPGPSRQVWITFNPYLPHGKTHCLWCG